MTGNCTILRRSSGAKLFHCIGCIIIVGCWEVCWACWESSEDIGFLLDNDYERHCYLRVTMGVTALLLIFYYDGLLQITMSVSGVGFNLFFQTCSMARIVVANPVLIYGILVHVCSASI